MLTLRRPGTEHTDRPSVPSDRRPGSVRVIAAVLASLACAEAVQVYVGHSLMDSPVSWWTAVGITAPSWGVLLVLVLPLLWWLGRRPGEILHPRGLTVLSGIGVAFVALHLTGSALVDGLLFPDQAGVGARILELGSTYFVLDLLTYVAIVGTHDALRRHDEDMRRQLHAARRTAEASEARLTAIEGKLQPDFFFNTLNAVSGLLGRGDFGKGAEALSALGCLVRTALTPAPSGFALEEELRIVGDYLRIQKLRFPGRFAASVSAADAVSGVVVPPMILVQLVEAVVNGGLESGTDFRLDLTARRDLGGVRVDLVHTAPALTEDPIVGMASRNLAALHPRSHLVMGEGGRMSLRFEPRVVGTASEALP